MKIRIIKEVLLFEDDFTIGDIVEATKTDKGYYLVDDCLVYKSECEEVK